MRKATDQASARVFTSRPCGRPRRCRKTGVGDLFDAVVDRLDHRDAPAGLPEQHHALPDDVGGDQAGAERPAASESPDAGDVEAEQRFSAGSPGQQQQDWSHDADDHQAAPSGDRHGNPDQQAGDEIFFSKAVARWSVSVRRRRTLPLLKWVRQWQPHEPPPPWHGGSSNELPFRPPRKKQSRRP